MITTSAAALRTALSATSLIHRARPALPILAGVLIQTRDGAATVTGYDFDTCITMTLPGEAPGPDARFVVDHTALIKAVKAVRGSTATLADVPATLTLHEQTVTVTVGATTVELQTLPADDWPVMPAPVPPDVGVDRLEFARGARAAACAVERSDALPVLTAIHLRMTPREIVLEATDRYRVVSVHTPTLAVLTPGLNATALVPGRVFAKLLSKTTFEHAAIGVRADPRGEGWVSVHSGALVATLRLIPATPVSLAPWVPRESETTATVNRRAFAALLAVADTNTAGHEHPQVTVRMSVDSISVSADPTVEGTPISADVHGLLTPVTFTARYLSDALATMRATTITLHLSPGRKVASLVPEGAPLALSAEHLHMIAPVKPVKPIRL
ncbi:DNA polymerase III subunit beta [Nocardiopsis tropica]|uniref:DNA polymerase III subunit beta n=1 Tax=Nocardiopsis tropica TaxID=109330 RepID=UPI002E871554|nr:DNA polymerase III subunit beta [Nocardiopsis tropica]